jgi:hypothetical protein
MEQDKNDENLPIEAVTATGNYLASANSFDLLQRLAKMFANSELTPEAYRGKVADCAIAINAAKNAGLDPLFFLQHSFPHKGKIGLDSQVAISLIRKRFKKVAFRYSGEGESRACTCIVSDPDGNEFEETVSLQMAHNMGWTRDKERGFNFWKAIPDRMLAYRSASFLARLYCPDLLSGAQFEDEILDVDGVQVVRQSKAKNLQERLSASVNKPASSED